jgi:RNA polymerase sigma-70 factor (ECF subfamily)
VSTDHTELRRHTRTALEGAPDGILVARAADGDVVAFEEIARRHGAGLRVYARRLLGSELESDDVVQEAFVLAWKQMHGVSEGGSIRSWLMRVVTNKAIDRMRVRKNFVELDSVAAPSPEIMNPDHIVEVKLQFDALSAAVKRLPETQQQTWILREIGGASYTEIAEHLALPVSTVRGQLARARQTLVDEMKAWR